MHGYRVGCGSVKRWISHGLFITMRFSITYNGIAFPLLSNRYVASVDTSQLEGSTSTSDIDSCDPLMYNGSLVLHPCGLVANTLFNDIIQLTSGTVMNENGIAWKSDIEDKVDWTEL